MSRTGVEVDLPEGLDPTLNELFNRDPLEWESKDRAVVIAHLRETREIFAKEDKQAKTKGKPANAKAAIKSGGTKNLTLDDLGLGDL